MIDLGYISTIGGRKRQEDALTHWGDGVTRSATHAAGPSPSLSGPSGGVVFAVADGLGGHPNGDKAAQAVCKGLAGALTLAGTSSAENTFAALHNLALKAGGSTCLMVVQIGQTYDAVPEFQIGEGRPQYRAGRTVGARATFWWVGDCTAVVLRRSPYAPTYREAFKTERDGIHNIVGSFLGVTDHDMEHLRRAQRVGWWSPHVASCDLLPGDMVIAMTDGFDDVFGAEGEPSRENDAIRCATLKSLYDRRDESATALAGALERGTRRAGATDNATCYVLKFDHRADGAGGTP